MVSKDNKTIGMAKKRSILVEKKHITKKYVSRNEQLIQKKLEFVRLQKEKFLEEHALKIELLRKETPRKCLLRTYYFDEKLWNYYAGFYCYNYTNSARLYFRYNYTAYPIMCRNQSTSLPVAIVDNTLFAFYDYTNTTSMNYIKKSFRSDALYNNFINCCHEAVQCCENEMTVNNIQYSKLEIYLVIQPTARLYGTLGHVFHLHKSTQPLGKPVAVRPINHQTTFADKAKKNAIGTKHTNLQYGRTKPITLYVQSLPFTKEDTRSM
ncbi:hypothetical protein NQ317_010535 [Molorchus minor]|uniref:Uncharacterized protein n=1 Tax=Molorchus minor TaxID=1323400 RepID=A0ABQ9K1A3_9CUCU|nr:hypothetical protein NQ317_010535 [Molorchus minor]